MASPDTRQIRERVLRALQAARTPGFHFPGYFLDIRWETVTSAYSKLSMPDGPHLRNAQGDVDLLAVCVLADTALGTAVRARDRTSGRLSTIHLQLQFTGVVARGGLQAEAQLLHTSTDTKLQQRLSSVVLLANGEKICYGSGAFVCLEAPPDVALGPLPWQSRIAAKKEPISEEKLSAEESQVMQHCDLQLASNDRTFIERFWIGPASRNASDGLEFPTGAHTTNRVGHVQGGLLVGAAALAGIVAAPPGMRLSNISAWFLSPGRGTLRVRSEILHRGRNTALAKCAIETDTGEAILRAMTQHVSIATTE